MLEKLNKDQEELIRIYRDRFIGYCYNRSNKDYNKDKAIEFIEFLYNLSGLEKPKLILHMDSPYSSQVAANILNLDTQVLDKVRAQVWDQVGDQVWEQVWGQVWDQVGDQVLDKVRAQVGDQVGAQVWDQVGAQVWGQVLDKVRAQVWEQVWGQVLDKVRAQVGAQVRDQVWGQVGGQVWDQVWEQVGGQVGAQVRAQVLDKVRAQVRDQSLIFYSFSHYGDISDYSWLSFYSFFIDNNLVAIKKDLKDKFIHFRDLLIESNIFNLILFKDVAIISKKPEYIRRKGANLHSENAPAIKFKDGFSLYFWNKVLVPEKLIINSNEITKKDILDISNAEIRRCYQEKLGARRYYDLLSDGKGLKLINESIDNQGNSMKLYETSFNDDIISKRVRFYEGTCPSTGRVYNIFPPDQDFDTATEAKKSTFQNQSINFRQGDVGVKVKTDDKFISIET